MTPEQTEQPRETKEEIATLYRQGFGLRQIAKMTGKAQTNVKRTLQNAGLYQGAERTDALPDRNPKDFRQWQKENCVVFVGDTGAAVDFLSGGGSLTCPVPASVAGKLIRLAVKIQPSGEAASVALGVRTAEGILHATRLGVVRHFVPQEFHHKGRAQLGDHFCIGGGASTVLLSDLHIEELPEPPPLPNPDLYAWQAEAGALVSPTRHGWRVELPDERSRLFTVFPFDRALSFAAEVFLSSPHAGVVGCTIRHAGGQEEGALELRHSDQPLTLRIRTHRCEGETSIELKGHAPFYTLSPLVLLLRNITLTGEERETVQLAMPLERKDGEA